MIQMEAFQVKIAAMAVAGSARIAIRFPKAAQK